MNQTEPVRDEAAEDRASAFAGLWAVARAIEDSRHQRPGMQRRREWAKQIDRCAKAIADTLPADLTEPQEPTS